MITAFTAPASRILNLLFAFLSLSLFAPAFADDFDQTIRVGLATFRNPIRIIIQAQGEFEIFQGTNSTAIREVGNQQISFRTNFQKIDLMVDGGEVGTFDSPLRIIPRDLNSHLDVIQPRSVRYRRTLEIANVKFRLRGVNELPLEEYVRGVIPAEIPARFHPTAQKALTIAIRTYALKNLNRHQSEGFHLCDTSHCQNFAGASRDAAWIEKLIEQTRGEIIVFENEPIHAMYSSSCGGATQNNEDANVGRQSLPYLRSVSDMPSSPDAQPYCSESRFHNWEVEYSVDDLKRIFARILPKEIGEFECLEFAEYDASERVGTVKILCSDGEFSINGHRFREIMGHDVIKSLRMKLAISPEGVYVIEGNGYGHGVGMCQHGANGMAKSCDTVTYQDIIKHYYTGVEIKPISEVLR